VESGLQDALRNLSAQRTVLWNAKCTHHVHQADVQRLQIMVRQVVQIQRDSWRFLYGQLLHRKQQHRRRRAGTYRMHPSPFKVNGPEQVLSEAGQMCLETTGNGLTVLRSWSPLSLLFFSLPPMPRAHMLGLLHTVDLLRALFYLLFILHTVDSLRAPFHLLFILHMVDSPRAPFHLLFILHTLSHRPSLKDVPPVYKLVLDH
jgi:hypothetical protein